LIAFPFDFFLQNNEKEMTKIQYLQSTKQKRRNLNITEPQEIPRQRPSRHSLLTPYRLINDRDPYNDSYDVFVPVYEYGCNI